MTDDQRIESSRVLYARAIRNADASALSDAERILASVEADLALAHGRNLHGRYLLQRIQHSDAAREDPDELAQFEHAAQLYKAHENARGEGEALFWIGCLHQVIRRDNSTAVPLLRRSLELASQVGDKATMAEALRHLGIADHARGNLDAARQSLEHSTRLRREIGDLPGVAANLIGLSYIASGEGHRDEALALAAESRQIAAAHGNHAIIRDIQDLEAALDEGR